MKKEINILWLAAAMWLLLLFGACQHQTRSLSPEAYVQYLEAPEHEMRRMIESGNTIYTIQVATPAYIACRDAAGMNKASEKIRERMSDLKGSLFFLIAIRSKDPKISPLNNEQMALYYQGEVVNDLLLKNSIREFRPAVCHFENNLGLSPQNTLVAGFMPGDSLRGDLQLILNDRYSGNPLIQASFSGAEIASLPTLNIR